MLVCKKSELFTEREVSTQEGNALAKELGCDFVEASAKNNIDVDKAFYDVVRRLRKQRQDLNRVERRATNTGPVGALNNPDPRMHRAKQKKHKDHKSCVIL